MARSPLLTDDERTQLTKEFDSFIVAYNLLETMFEEISRQHRLRFSNGQYASLAAKEAAMKEVYSAINIALAARNDLLYELVEKTFTGTISRYVATYRNIATTTRVPNLKSSYVYEIESKLLVLRWLMMDGTTRSDIDMFANAAGFCAAWLDAVYQAQRDGIISVE